VPPRPALATLLLAALPVGPLLVVGTGCREEPDGAGSPALRELERLAFLPPGELRLSVPVGDGSAELRVFRVERPLLVDRFEATRGEWLRYLDEPGVGTDPVLQRHVGGWAAGTERWPASFMTQPEASAFAAARGMRLLEPGEWLWCAMGPNRWSYPWGTTPQDSVANTLELDLGRPTPVGTFESGRTPSGCYDMLGNVAEWLGSAAPSIDLGPGDERVSAIGGSFRTWRSPIYKAKSILAATLHPASRLDHVGLRCCVEAEAYLWERAPAWGEDQDTLRRLVALGRRWGRPSATLLQDLAARPGAPRGLRALAEGARP